MPRRDDVRRLGQHRPRRVDPRSSTARSTPGSTSSTPPTSTRAASPRRSSARRSPAAGATTSCSPPRSTARWATTPTSAATRAAGSSREVENSLRRLGTDWIDLYQIHRPEPDTDIDETLGALTDLVRAGQGPLLRLARPSRRAQIVEAQWVAERRGRERFVCEQPPYSMLVRGIEADVLPTCRALRHGRDPVEPAGRRLADRALPQGPGRCRPAAAPSASRTATTCRCPATSASSRPPTQLAQLAERGRAVADPPGARLRARPPGGHRGDHRPAHDGAARVPARRRRRRRSSDDVLDRIDEIVPPGTNLNPTDAGWQNPALARGARRRSA